MQDSSLQKELSKQIDNDGDDPGTQNVQSLTDSSDLQSHLWRSGPGRRRRGALTLTLTLSWRWCFEVGRLSLTLPLDFLRGLGRWRLLSVTRTLLHAETLHLRCEVGWLWHCDVDVQLVLNDVTDSYVSESADDLGVEVLRILDAAVEGNLRGHLQVNV